MRSSTRSVALILACGLGLAVIQQQLLLWRPPRLLQLRASTTSSGPAALDLQFSRPMQRGSVASLSRLHPDLGFRWMGEDNPLRLLLLPGQSLDGPITLQLGGRDRRGLAMATQRWQWDPRPRLLAVVAVAEGEQLQVQLRDGRWRPLTRPFRRIVELIPLGDGSGIAFLSGDGQGRRQLWLLPLEQKNLVLSAGLAEPLPGAPRRLDPGSLLHAHLSSNRRGDLLVQSASSALARERTQLWRRDGGRQELTLGAAGPVQLLPEGGAVMIPSIDGLLLKPLPGQLQKEQILPGSRDLSSFCPVSGRALLVRHWPDYRRSLELVEPGQPPFQLWIGEGSVLASACDRGGERVWLLINPSPEALAPELLALDRRGRLIGKRPLLGWAPEPGLSMAFDATRQQLLLVLRRGNQWPQPVLVDVRDLRLRPVAKPVLKAVWLPAF